MSIDCEYQTFLEIQNAVITDSKGGEQARDRIKRYINQGYADLITRRKRAFLDTSYQYVIPGAIQGSCSLTLGSPTVTWTDTSTAIVFDADNTYKFWVQGQPEIYDVVSATTSTITLDLDFLGPTDTAAEGVLVVDSIRVAQEIKTVYQVSHDYFQRTVNLVGPQELQIIKNYQFNQVLGKARHACAHKKTSDGEWRLFTYPYADEDYIVNVQANNYFTKLVNDDDEPLIPPEYRQILYFYALAQEYQLQRNSSWHQIAMTNYNIWLARMDTELFGSQDEPRLVFPYTNRFINPFMRYRNTNRLEPEDDN